MRIRQTLTLFVAASVFCSPVLGDDGKPAKAKSARQVAIDKGLAFLATQQQNSGAWQLKSRRDSTAITSLVVLAYLSNGHTPGKGVYGQRILKGIDWVISQQRATQKDDQKKTNEPGLLSASRTHGPMYDHGISTLMLAEALGKLDKKRQVRCRAALEKAVQLILKSQSVKKSARHSGGWRYQPFSQDSDLSVTVWHLKALCAAKKAGIKIPADAITRGAEYVVKCRSRFGNGFGYQPAGAATAVRTGTGISCLQLCGQEKSKAVTTAVDYLTRRQLRTHDTYFYYGAYACSAAAAKLDQKHRQAILPGIRKILVSNQLQDGSWISRASERYHGYSYCTALAVLGLSVDSKSLLIHQ